MVEVPSIPQGRAAQASRAGTDGEGGARGRVSSMACTRQPLTSTDGARGSGSASAGAPRAFIKPTCAHRLPFVPIQHKQAERGRGLEGELGKPGARGPAPVGMPEAARPAHMPAAVTHDAGPGAG